MLSVFSQSKIFFKSVLNLIEFRSNPPNVFCKYTADTGEHPLPKCYFNKIAKQLY